jgi:superoxide oxidase
MTASTARHPLPLIILHWLTAVLVVVAYLLSEGGPRIRLDPPTWHFATGFLVLLLVVPRLLVRATTKPLPPPPGTSRQAELAAKAMAGLLYLLMICVPLGGWYAMSRVGLRFSVAGWQLPAIAQAVQGPPGALAELHQVGGNALLVLAGLHALMGFWHQFKLKDNTLRRMSPH